MKKPRPTDEELLKLSHEDFVVWFLEYNNAIIARYISRRLIPNRYEPADVKAYMSERMLDILEKRLAKGKAIKNPRIYFGKLIDFWCIEYQRMHGYIYAMPKRPRNVKAEADISQYGFVYLDTDSIKNDNVDGFGQSPQLSYIDSNITQDQNYEQRGYQIKGIDPSEDTEFWSNIMGMILPEDRPVLTCLYKMNMSIPETSRHLGIAVSTAYSRRDRGLLAISGVVTSVANPDNPSWKVLNELSEVQTGNLDISEIFKNMM